MEHSNIRIHILHLIELACIDNLFSESEREHIRILAKANAIDDDEYENLIHDVQKKNSSVGGFIGLNEHEKFNYLFDIIQLMKIDGEVYLSEIKFCEDLAEKMGYNRKVVKELSSKVYSDPTISSNRTILENIAKKYLK